MPCPYVVEGRLGGMMSFSPRTAHIGWSGGGFVPQAGAGGYMTPMQLAPVPGMFAPPLMLASHPVIVQVVLPTPDGASGFGGQ